MTESNCVFMRLYNEYVTDVSDPRVKDMLFMSSPLPTILLVILYLLLVKRCFPKFMEKRNPYELTRVYIIYSAFQCILSSVLICNATVNGWLTNFSFFPKSVNLRSSPESAVILNISWSLFAIRFLDFIDTIILILRKDHKDVKAFHIFQRSVDLIATWFVIKLVPDSHYTFASYLHVFGNIFVHSNIFQKELISMLQAALQLINILQLFVVTFTLSEYYVNFYGTLFFGYSILSFILFWKDREMNEIGCPFKNSCINFEVFDQIRNAFAKFGNICVMNQEELFKDDDEDVKQAKKSHLE